MAVAPSIRVGVVGEAPVWVGERPAPAGRAPRGPAPDGPRFGGDLDWFNTERAGSGNGGHDVWPRIGTDANRYALIEYLKTLQCHVEQLQNRERGRRDVAQPDQAPGQAIERPEAGWREPR